MANYYGRHVVVRMVSGETAVAERGYVETCGMGRLRIRKADGTIREFPLKHVTIELDGEGYNELRPATMPKANGIRKKRSPKQKAKFHTDTRRDGLGVRKVKTPYKRERLVWRDTCSGWGDLEG